MKKRILLSLAVAVCTLAAYTPSFAASTSAGINVSRGQSDSMAYSLNITQSYEPWIEGEAFEFTPFAEIEGHAWVPDHEDSDTVWGGSLSPGLRFCLNTTANFRPFVEGSAGPQVNSKRKIEDKRDLGSHVLLRARGSVGVNFGESLRHTLRGDYTHSGNLGMANHNDGYSTYGVSYGYSF